MSHSSPPALVFGADVTGLAVVRALGRNGVPVYVLYRPGKEPLLLPEVLQKATVIDALATLDSEQKRAAR